MRANPPMAHSLTRHASRPTHAEPHSALPKKMSASSLTHLVDIDRLIDDIKITPQHPPLLPPNALLQQHIAIITHSLNALKEVPGIVHEIRTIELLLQSIGKKVAAEGLAVTRVRHAQSVQQRQSSVGKSTLSPVKQFDESSRIVYANFSLKDMNATQQLETPIKRIASSDQKDKEEFEEMQRLNSQIMVLEKMLKAKGVASQSKPESRKGAVQTSNAKQKENKGLMGTGKKYELLERTQEITLARPKPVTIRPKPDTNYR